MTQTAIVGNSSKGRFILRVKGSPISRSIFISDHVYKIVELAGSYKQGIEDAIQCAITRAGESLRNLRWFEVVQTRGHIENGAVHDYQVVLKVGFTMEEPMTKIRHPT